MVPLESDGTPATSSSERTQSQGSSPYAHRAVEISRAEERPELPEDAELPSARARGAQRVIVAEGAGRRREVGHQHSETALPADRA